MVLQQKKISTNRVPDFLTPPGGLMVWVFIICELLVFGAALLVFGYEKSLSLEMFETSRNMLNQLYGTINTVILITSGFLVVKASKSNHLGENKKTIYFLSLASFLGLLFLILKLIEYYEKFKLNITLGHNTFFDFYWILTAFHALHVVLGIIILLILIYKTIKQTPYVEDDFNFETGCMFWHMCDLIWILVFPVIYLL